MNVLLTESMNFEIVEDIQAVETIAVGKSIRDLARLKRIYGPGRWRSLRALHVCGCKAAGSGSRNCIGTKPMVLVRNLRVPSSSPSVRLE